jgi:hypothetical protein
MIKKVIVLLLVALILTKQRGLNAKSLSQITPREAQCGGDLFYEVILHLTLLNEVGKSIKGHVFVDLVFLDGGSVQLLVT